MKFLVIVSLIWSLSRRPKTPLQMVFLGLVLGSDVFNINEDCCFLPFNKSFF